MGRRDVKQAGRGRNRERLLPGGEWAVLIPKHLSGSTGWAIFETNPAPRTRNFPSVAKTALIAGEAEDQSALKQFRLPLERAHYEAQRAERRYRRVEPENRVVVRTLKTEWDNKLQGQRSAEAQSVRQEWPQPLQLTNAQREQIRALVGGIKRVGTAPTTTDRDRQELLCNLREEVKTNVPSDQVHLLYPDTVLAGVLDQPRKTTGSESFTPNHMASPAGQQALRPRLCSGGSMTDSSRASQSRPELPGPFS